MSTRITHVATNAAFETLLAVLIEYERSLDSDLRHGTEPTLASIRESYQDPNAAFLAFVDDQPAGSVVATHLDTSTTVLKRLYVKPQFRGHGLARGLLQAVIDFARARGYRRVVLDTAAERLAAAYNLYVSYGFTPCDAYESVDYRHPTFLEFVL